MCFILLGGMLTSFFLYTSLVTMFTYIVIIFDIYIYIWYMSSSPTSTCVVSFLSLYTYFFIVCNLLILFHTKMPWLVLFQVFQKYRLSKSSMLWTFFLQSFFKSLCEDRFYYIQQVSISWVIYNFSYMFICLLWFCHRLPKGEIVRTYVI